MELSTKNIEAVLRGVGDKSDDVSLARIELAEIKRKLRIVNQAGYVVHLVVAIEHEMSDDAQGLRFLSDELEELYDRVLNLSYEIKEG